MPVLLCEMLVDIHTRLLQFATLLQQLDFVLSVHKPKYDSRGLLRIGIFPLLRAGIFPWKRVAGRDVLALNEDLSTGEELDNLGFDGLDLRV